MAKALSYAEQVDASTKLCQDILARLQKLDIPTPPPREVQDGPLADLDQMMADLQNDSHTQRFLLHVMQIVSEGLRIIHKAAPPDSPASEFHDSTMAQIKAVVQDIKAEEPPVDKPVKILLSSRDVIHSFYVPDFRI